MNSLHGLATRWTPLPSAPIGACRLRQRHQRNQAPSNLCILGTKYVASSGQSHQRFAGSMNDYSGLVGTAFMLSALSDYRMS